MRTIPTTAPFDPADLQVDLAREISRLAMERWGDRKNTVLIGRHETLTAALRRLARFAPANAPVLITGETGTGKELFARALYLLSPQRRGPFLVVNCAQYQDSQLIASELFGHKRGSFTGAVGDHKGVFEACNGGVVFLDEVAELSPGAQSMLLRAISEREVVPVGETAPRPVKVRVVAATSRDLRSMVRAGTFRDDLYRRLGHFCVRVPPVRERGDDWELIISYYLHQLASRCGTCKSFSEAARGLMSGYPWPGNVRELQSVVEVGFYLSTGPVIDPQVLVEELEGITREQQLRGISSKVQHASRLERIIEAGESFWDVVHRPFMDRDLNRAEVQAIIAAGLARSQWSYKRLVRLFGVDDDQYLKFMDFLRHHDLKPQR